MVQFDQNYGFYLRKQFEIGFSIVLAIFSLFLLICFITQCLWKKNKSLIFNILITKILSLRNKFPSTKLKKATKNGFFSKKTIQEFNKNSKRQDLTSVQLIPEDLVMNEVLYESSLKGFLEETKSCLNDKYREIRSLLRVSQSAQVLSVYQPFLILCVLAFNMKQVILTVPIKHNDENTVSVEPEQIGSSDYSKQYYAAIGMIAISVIVFLVLNVSNVLITFINNCKAKTNTIVPEQLHSVGFQNEATELPPRKYAIENVKKAMKDREKTGQKESSKRAPKLSFKMKNSLNLLHLLHILPLFFTIGIITYLRT